MIELRATDDGTLNISGGDITSGIIALNDSSVTIFGTGFNLPLGDILGLQGTLTGTLADGSPLNVNFGRASSARITLVPDPSTALLLAAGLVGLAMRRRLN